MTDLRLKNIRLPQAPGEIAEALISNGRFVEKLSNTAAILDLKGAMIFPGLIETHLHLDKACILHRCNLCEGTLQEAIRETSFAKARFTPEDIYLRAQQVLKKSITMGTTHIRTHVEIDPGIGLTGFNVIRQLRDDYAKYIGIEICVFPQEGLLNNPGTEDLLIEALEKGADLLGGCPYTDADPRGQLARLFDIAIKYDVDLDIHLDFDLNPASANLPELCRLTRLYGWQNRVTAGHVTSLSALPPERLREMVQMVVASGVNLTALPSTDMFLNGREHDFLIPRGVAPLLPFAHAGVACSISSNNIGNPFTPYGDASLIRQANLYANIAQLSTAEDLLHCLSWISTESARLLGLENYGLAPGCYADFIVMECATASDAIAEIAAPVMGFKRGIQTFYRPNAQMMDF
jgi:cytosine deaminase